MEGLEMEMQNLRNMIERLRGTQGTSETVRDLQQRVSFIERQLGIEGSRPVPDSNETSPEAVDESLGPAPGGDAIPLQRPDPEFTTTSQPAGGRPDPVEDDQIVHVTSPDLEEDKDLYKRAYDALSSARDQEAVNLFRKFLEKYPDSEHAADANYWLGEALFNKGLYDEAVLQFGKAIKDYPGAKKTASAYFKQGSAFEKMGDEKSALVVFERLVKKYPHTPQARLANKRVKALKSDSGEKPRD
jgi:tol-pal system protein YbgF